MPARIALVLGTAIEALELAPLVVRLRREPDLFEPLALVTAPRRGLLDRALAPFDVRPDMELDVAGEGRALAGLAARSLLALDAALAALEPDVVLVRGGSAAALAGALAALYRRVPVGHVGAGARSGDPAGPFPDEVNGILASRIAELHFAVAPAARANLLADGIAPERVYVTGSTGVDALLTTVARVRARAPARATRDAPERRRILVALEGEGAGAPPLHAVAAATRAIVLRAPAAEVVVAAAGAARRRDAEREFASVPRARVAAPLDYADLAAEVDRAAIVVTDSTHLEEAAPALGRPVLALRDATERPEGVAAGTTRLVGARAEGIAGAALELLTSPDAYERMARTRCAYGDGCACDRIADVLASRFAGFPRRAVAA